MRILGWGVLLLGVTAAPVWARKSAQSWARPGVSYDLYRADATECAKRGYFRDVSRDEPAKRFIRGWRTADDSLNLRGADAADWTYTILRTQPDRKMRQVQAIQVADVERCLTDKGYRKFDLTRAEERTLARYPAGSDDRQRYLHGLAMAQRQVPTPSRDRNDAKDGASGMD